jgi:hypothetical protein
LENFIKNLVEKTPVRQTKKKTLTRTCQVAFFYAGYVLPEIFIKNFK